jgi:broad specificity phosphatase PhoE
MSQTVWITRHGNRQDFVDPFWYKSAERPFDPALSDDGLIQAQDLSQRLRGESITHIFASPFLRTIQTAHQIAEVLQLKLKLELGFGEHLSPKWFQSMPPLLSQEQLSTQYPRIDWSYVSCLVPKYPESYAEAIYRAGQAAQMITQAYPGNLVIVGHGVSMLGATWGLLPQRPKINCSLCGLVKLVRQEQGWSAELKGDSSHLSGPSSRLSSLLQYWLGGKGWSNRWRYR